MLLLLAALLPSPALAADTVTLNYVPGVPGPAALRCTGEREKRIGDQVAKNRMELRAVPSVKKAGDNWAVGTERIEVLSSEPPPPPGAPPLEALLARVEEVMPDTLLDARGQFAGVEAVDPERQDAALTALLSGLPAPLVDRLKAALLPTLGAAAIEARFRESWYVHTGHWLGRTLPVGRAEVGEAKPGDPLVAGTTLTWSATRRAACGGKGPAECVELRLDAKSPPDAGVAQASAVLAGVAQAFGVAPDTVKIDSGAVSTTWTTLVDPATLAAWGTERRRLVDAQFTVAGQTVAASTSDVFRCVAE